MKICCYILLFLQSISCLSQEGDYYFITAKSGLNVRALNNLSAKKTAKIPYGVLVEKLEETNTELVINDAGKQIKGKWVKIKFDNYTYLVSEETEKFEAEGYVFDGYLKKRNKIAIKNQIISKAEYNKLFDKTEEITYQPKRIADLDSIKTILNGRVTWVTEFKNEEDKRDNLLKSIITNNGQELILGLPEDNAIYFNNYEGGYYPDEEIFVLIEGPGINKCYSIKTGENELTIGNPEYIVPSPKGTYRLNGFYRSEDGCYMSYFFQMRENNEYVYLGELEGDEFVPVCNFSNFKWINENQFVYRREEDLEEGEAYHLGTIKQ